MHQYDIRPMRRQCFEAGAYGGLPRGAAEDRRQHGEAARGNFIEFYVVGMDDRLHQADLFFAGEQAEAETDHRLADERPIGLGHTGSRPASAPGRHDHCCNSVRHRPNSENSPIASSLRRFRSSRPYIFCCTATLAPGYKMAKLYALYQFA